MRCPAGGGLTPPGKQRPGAGPLPRWPSPLMGTLQVKPGAHRGICELLPLRRDEVPDPIASSGQGDSSDEKDHEHDVRKRGREVNHLEKPCNRGWVERACSTGQRNINGGRWDLPPGRRCPMGGHPGLGTWERHWDQR